MHHDRCNIRHDGLLSNEYGVGRNSALPGSRGCLDFMFFCHVPLTTFCFCYALGGTVGSDPLRTSMDSAVPSLKCPMFGSRAAQASLRECPSLPMAYFAARWVHVSEVVGHIFSVRPYSIGWVSTTCSLPFLPRLTCSSPLKVLTRPFSI